VHFTFPRQQILGELRNEFNISARRAGSISGESRPAREAGLTRGDRRRLNGAVRRPLRLPGCLQPACSRATSQRRNPGCSSSSSYRTRVRFPLPPPVSSARSDSCNADLVVEEHWRKIDRRDLLRGDRQAERILALLIAWLAPLGTPWQCGFSGEARRNEQSADQTVRNEISRLVVGRDFQEKCPLHSIQWLTPVT
jgi:hypothetical protein